MTIKKAIEILLVAGMLLVGAQGLIQFTTAQGSEQQKVPTPNVIEHHNFNTVGGQNEQDHEYWSVSMECGDTNLNLIAMNVTQQDMQGQWQPQKVTYQQNMQYYVGNINYIAMLEFQDVAFVIGNQTVTANLTKCSGFVLTHSPVQYNGLVPGFDCNITFNNVQIYPGS